MAEALEMHGYLPLSYKSEGERDYIAFLWDAFNTNAQHGKYQFALLAYHMLTMCSIYFNIWQIKLSMPREFENAMVGFAKDLEKELMGATSPFVFWRVGESNVMRFLKLIGCKNDKVGQCATLVKERNESAHANGNIFFSSKEAFEAKITRVLGTLEDIEAHSQPVVERLYIEFLKASQDTEERDYIDEHDQIREVLIHPNYFSQRDVSVCLSYNISALVGEPGFNAIELLHEALRGFASDL